MVSSNRSIRHFFQAPAFIVALISLVAIIGYVIWILVWNPTVPTEQPVSSILLITLSILFAGFSLDLALNRRLSRRLRVSWFLFGLAGLSNCLAETIWFYYESILAVDPYVTIGDFFFLLYYPLILSGILLLPFSTAEGEERAVLWLDLWIVVATGLMLLWYFVLYPMGELSGDLWRLLVSVSYPAGAIMTVAVIAALIQRNVHSVAHWPLFLLGCGMLCNALSDALLAFFELNGIQYDIRQLNLLWMFSLFFMLTAAGWQDGLEENPEEREPTLEEGRRYLLGRAIPYIAVLVGILLLVLSALSKSISSLQFRGVLVGMLSLIAFVMLRQHFILRQNIGLYRTMRKLAITDALTGVYNRLYADEMLESERSRALRYGHPLCVLMIDVDGFKQYNDQYGHLQGDEALKGVAKLLRGMIRSTDFLCRFGGDEFVVILPETTQAGAKVCAKRLKSRVDGHNFGHASLSITIGIASLQPGMSTVNLLEEADRGLYRQKLEKAN